MVLKMPFHDGTGEAELFRFIVWVSWETELEFFSWRTEIKVDTIVLVARWHWKGFSSVTLGKPQLCTFTVQVSSETEIWVVIWGHRAWSWYNNFSGKMVLKRPFVGDTGEALAVNVYCTHLLETEFELFYLEMELWVNSIVLFGRWSWKGYLSVTLGKSRFCTFIL